VTLPVAYTVVAKTDINTDKTTGKKQCVSSILKNEHFRRLLQWRPQLLNKDAAYAASYEFLNLVA